MNNTLDKSDSPTILVVDDLSMCREAVADILRLRGYDVHCAANGEEALKLIQGRLPSLVLLDVVMPGMGGIAVLRALRNNPRCRNLPVILLTDHAERELVQKAAALGVQGYLLKSAFTPSELLSRVERHVPPSTAAQAMTSEPPYASPTKPCTARQADNVESLSSEKVADSVPHDNTKPRKLQRDEVLAQIRRTLAMRPVPPVLQLVVSQTNSAGTSIQEVADTIRQDQALAIRIMKVANSSLYTTGKRARTLVEAAGRLGMSGIRNAVVAVVGFDHYADSADTGLVPQRFWEHSLGVAALAQALAENLKRDDAEEVFLAGLLHDIGRLVLAESFPDVYRELLSEAERSGTSLCSQEHETFGITHVDATREMLQHLGFPEEIISAAALHQRTPSQITTAEKSPQPALIVGLADRLAHALLLGSSGDPILAPVNEFLKALSVEPAALGAIGRDTVRKISDMQTFYACRAGTEFLASMADEVARKVPSRPEIAVLSPIAPNDVLSLFFEQLRWLHDTRAKAVAIHARTQADLKASLAQLVKQIEAGESPDKVLVIADDADLQVPDQIHELPIQTLKLPARYDELVSWAALQPAEVSLSNAHG